MSALLPMISVKPVGDLTAAQRSALRVLTLPQDSAMRDWLEGAEHRIACAAQHPSTTEGAALARFNAQRVVRALVNGAVVGWAVELVPYQPAVFVHESLRRRGIGRLLVAQLRESSRHHWRWTVKVQGEAAQAFWRAVGVPLRGAVP